MKKLIALLLAAAMCFALCACGSDNNTPKTIDATEQDNIDILGEWVWVGDKSNTITFNEDGTCQYSSGHTAKYSVNYDLSIITIHDTFTSNYNIINENGIIKLSCSADYVRKENYENANAEYIAAENAQKETNQLSAIDAFYLEGKENRDDLVFGKPYALNGTTNITFLSCSLGEYKDYYYTLNFNISIENNSENEVCVRDGFIANGPNEMVYIPADIIFTVESNVFANKKGSGKLLIDRIDGYDSAIVLEGNSSREYSATISIPTHTVTISAKEEIEYDFENHHQYVTITCADKELFLNVTDMIDQTIK